MRSLIATIQRLPLSLKRQRVLPGLVGGLAITLPILFLFAVLPITAMVLYALRLDSAEILAALSDKRLQSALWLSFSSSLIGAIVATPIGLLIAWALSRYTFPGRSVIDALIDVPFALPTAVTGIALAYLYGPHGFLGKWFNSVGIQIAYTRAGIVLALIFVSLPFVVRTLQPVIEALQRDREEAASTLGANDLQTFIRVVVPQLKTALATGFALSFARGVGEYGSVIFIAGNRPFSTEVAPLLIITKLEEVKYADAFVIASAMLFFSVLTLIVLTMVQRSKAAEATHG